MIDMRAVLLITTSILRTEEPRTALSNIKFAWLNRTGLLVAQVVPPQETMMSRLETILQAQRYLVH